MNYESRAPRPMSLRSDSQRHWPDLARQWARMGSPLRPAIEDVNSYTKIMERWTKGSMAAATCARFGGDG